MTNRAQFAPILTFKAICMYSLHGMLPALLILALASGLVIPDPKYSPLSRFPDSAPVVWFKRDLKLEVATNGHGTDKQASQHNLGLTGTELRPGFEAQNLAIALESHEKPKPKSDIKLPQSIDFQTSPELKRRDSDTPEDLSTEIEAGVPESQNSERSEVDVDVPQAEDTSDVQGVQNEDNEPSYVGPESNASQQTESIPNGANNVPDPEGSKTSGFDKDDSENPGAMISPDCPPVMDPESSDEDNDSEDCNVEEVSVPDETCQKSLRAVHGKLLRDLIRFYTTQSLKTKQEMILLYLRILEGLVVRKLNKGREYISSWDFDEFEMGRSKYIKKKLSSFLRSKTGSLLENFTIPFSLSVRILSNIAEHIRNGKTINSSTFSADSPLIQLAEQIARCSEQASKDPSELETLKSYKAFSVFDKLFGKNAGLVSDLAKRSSHTAWEDFEADSLLYSFSRTDTQYLKPEMDLKRVMEGSSSPVKIKDISLKKRGVNEQDRPSDREDCVPVTWYNVFHHSIFGKPNFCHT